jgi:hypothetical protein
MGNPKETVADDKKRLAAEAAVSTTNKTSCTHGSPC